MDEVYTNLEKGVKMFFEALEKLSPNDVRSLAAKGVPQPRISDWKAKRRVPTRPQAYALATVAGLDFDTLERELTLIEIEHDAQKNDGFADLVRMFRRQWQHS
jgi:hypothetical protein